MLGESTVDNGELISNILQTIAYKKYKREEEMKRALIKNIFEDSKKKVFVSFHYKSAVKYLKIIADVIKKSEHYWISEEDEKCNSIEIQKWIDEKIENTDVIIVIFNKDFSDSKWTKYEVEKSIQYNIPFLFLIKEDGNEIISQDFGNYIRQREITKYSVLKWRTVDDFQNIPSKLDELLKNR